MKSSPSASALISDLTGPETLNCRTSVHQTVSQLITSLQPLAVRKNNLLLNDIPRDLSVDMDKHTLAYMLTRLVNSAVESTENRCIHIEAIPAGDHTTIRVKDLNTHIYHTLDLHPILSTEMTYTA